MHERMNYGNKIQIMCGIIPLMLFNIYGLITNGMYTLSKTPPIPSLHASIHTKKLSFGSAIFKIGALVSNSFNEFKLKK